MGVLIPPLATKTISSAESLRLSDLGGGGGGGRPSSEEVRGGEGVSGGRGDAAGEGGRRRRRRGAVPGSHSLSSFAIFDAMFLKPMLVPAGLEYYGHW